jgi:hypothetical protein
VGTGLVRFVLPAGGLARGDHTLRLGVDAGGAPETFTVVARLL